MVDQKTSMLHHEDDSWEATAVIEVEDDDNLPKLAFRRAADRPTQIVAERRAGVGNWQKISSAQMADDVMDIAKGLHAIGIKRGESVAILAATSYEWAVLDLAILSIGAVTVPIYESDSASQISHILKDARVKSVITQTIQQSELVRSVGSKKLKEIYSLDKGAIRTLTKKGAKVSDEIIEEEISQTKLADTATIIYTSGTTGLPKGVMLSHSNFVSPIMQAYDILPALIDDENSRNLLFLPVAHVLARFVMHAILVGNGRIGFCPDTRTLLQDIESFKPTMMLTVPRVLEKVYNSASAKAGNGIKSKLFSWSALQAKRMSQATTYPAARPEDKVSPDAPGTQLTSEGPKLGLKVTHQMAEALVLRKIKKVLGPNLHTIICGGAPLSTDLAHFYRGLGITLLQGYGLSETTGPITVERPDDYPADSVGYLWPGNSAKLADDGELLLKGISVSPGYHNLPKATAAAYSDGWFCTGDIASIDADGRIKITGRKKELLVTAGGKNVSPEVLEQDLATHPLIGHVIVVGDDRPYIGALITLDPEMLPQWLRNKSLSVVPPHQAATLQEVKNSLERAISKANRRVSRAESIRRYRIVDAEFTVENGFLTPSLKLKRHRALEEYANQVELLYSLSADELAGIGGSIQPSTNSTN